MKENLCYQKKLLVSQVYFGCVKDKIVDSANHAALWVVLTHKGEIEKLNLSIGARHVFDSIKVGDTLIKRQYSDTIILKRDGNILKLKVDIPCEK